MRITLPQTRKLVYEMAIPMRWGDMDAMGHLNNCSYFRYFETCRIDWMRSLNVDPVRDGEGIVIVNAFCNFVRQLVYPGDVRMRLYASDPGRTSFETWVTMERADEPGVLYAEGGATTIWYEMATQRAKTLPDWLRERVTP